jgi:Trypsin
MTKLSRAPSTKTLASGMLAVLACFSTAPHAQTAVERALANVVGAGASQLNPDELDAAIAQRVPGYAGTVSGTNGAPLVMLTGSSQLLAGDRAIDWKRADTVQTRLLKSMGTNTQIAAAKWDAAQLLQFKRAAFALPSAKGVVMTYIDRASNQVVVGYDQALSSGAGSAQLRSELVAAGVPADAIKLKAMEPLRAFQSVGQPIASQTGPVSGGSQIQFSPEAFVTANCSVGIPAVVNGVVGFITASHCGTTYNMTSQSFRSPVYSSPQTAVESVDPMPIYCSQFGFSNAAVRCRNADVLFATASLPAAVRMGTILLATPGSLVVTGLLNVVGTRDSVAVGDTVWKSGRTTGTTSSSVQATCVDARVSSSLKEYGVLCTTVAANNNLSFGAPGDSGGPVFTRSGNNATLTGFVSYGNSEILGYTPWGQVKKDLGTNITVR